MSAGWVSEVDAMVVGQVCLSLGAGRITDTTTIDPAVGLVISKHIGDTVKQGEIWATVHHTAPVLAADIAAQLERALNVTPVAVKKPDIIIEAIQ